MVVQWFFSIKSEKNHSKTVKLPKLGESCTRSPPIHHCQRGQLTCFNVQLSKKKKREKIHDLRRKTFTCTFIYHVLCFLWGKHGKTFFVTKQHIISWRRFHPQGGFLLGEPGVGIFSKDKTHTQKLRARWNIHQSLIHRIETQKIPTVLLHKFTLASQL